MSHLSGRPLVVAAVAFAALAAVLVLPGWRAGGSDLSSETGLVARVERRTFDVRAVAVGDLQPASSTTISSGIRSNRGKILEIADDGARVEEGDLLVLFDATPFEEDVREAEVALG